MRPPSCNHNLVLRKEKKACIIFRENFTYSMSLQSLASPLIIIIFFVIIVIIIVIIIIIIIFFAIIIVISC